MKKFLQKLKHSISKRLFYVPMRILYMFRGYEIVGGLRLPVYEYSKTSRSQLLKGGYEAVEVSLIKKYMPKGVYVVEFGASIGIISCHILKKEPVKLLSFEAVGDWVKLARKTVSMNYTNPPFELNEVAIGRVGQTEVSFMFDPNENLGGQAKEKQSQDTIRSSITVPALSLFEINKIYNVPRNAWLVMDIEGAEWDLAKNQGDALGVYEGVIVECHKIADDILPQKIIEEFIRCGFSLIESVAHHTHVVAFFLRVHSQSSHPTTRN